MCGVGVTSHRGFKPIVSPRKQFVILVKVRVVFVVVVMVVDF